MRNKKQIMESLMDKSFADFESCLGLIKTAMILDG